MLLATLLLGVGTASFLRGPGTSCPAFVGQHAAITRTGLIVAAAKKEEPAPKKKAAAKPKAQKADDAAALRAELEKMKADYAQLQRSIEQQDKYIPELQMQLQYATTELHMAMTAMQQQQSMPPPRNQGDPAASQPNMEPNMARPAPKQRTMVSRRPPSGQEGDQQVAPKTLGRVVPTTRAPPSNRTRGYDAEKRRLARQTAPMPPRVFAMGPASGGVVRTMAPPVIPKKEGPNLWGADNRRDLRASSPPAPPLPREQLQGPGPGAPAGTSTEAIKREDEPLRGAAARRAVRNAAPHVKTNYRVGARGGSAGVAQPAAVDKDGEPLRGGAARRAAREQNPFQARPAVAAMVQNPYATAYQPTTPYEAMTPSQRRKAMREQAGPMVGMGPMAGMPGMPGMGGIGGMGMGPMAGGMGGGYESAILRGANARRMSQMGGTYPIQTPYQAGLPATYGNLQGADVRRVARGAYTMGTVQTPYLPRPVPGMMGDAYEMPQLTWEWQGTFSS